MDSVISDAGATSDLAAATGAAPGARTPLESSADNGLKIAAVGGFGVGLGVGKTTRIREALDLDPHVPLLDCDARSRESGKRVLITLVERHPSLYVPRSPELAL